MEFKSGQILNWNPGTRWFDKFINFGNMLHYGRPGYAHSAIIAKTGFMPDGITPGALVYEALDKIACNWYEIWWLEDKFNEGKLGVGTTTLPLKSVERNCEKYLGDSYDFGDVIDIAIYYLTGNLDSRKSSDDAFICSEFVATVIQDSNKDINFVTELGIPLCYITPMDLGLSKQIKWEEN